MHKEVKEMVKALRALGLVVQETGCGRDQPGRPGARGQATHPRVLLPDGRLLCTLPKTPHGQGWRGEVRSKVRRAGYDVKGLP